MLSICRYLYLFQAISLATDRLKSIWGVKKLLGLYILFHTLYVLYDLASGKPLTFGRVIVPSFGLWYLFSLCIWRILPQFMWNSMIKYPILYIVGSLLLCILGGFIPIDSQLSFQRTICFLPFFILGFYAKHYNVANALRSHNIKTIVSIITIFLTIFVYIKLPVFYGNAHYADYSDLFLRTIHIIIASVFSICVLLLTPKTLHVFTKLGSYTLIIYLFHPPIILIGKKILNILNIESNPLNGLIIAISSILIIYLIKDFKLMKFLN